MRSGMFGVNSSKFHVFVQFRSWSSETISRNVTQRIICYHVFAAKPLTIWVVVENTLIVTKWAYRKQANVTKSIGKCHCYQSARKLRWAGAQVLGNSNDVIMSLHHSIIITCLGLPPALVFLFLKKKVLVEKLGMPASPAMHEIQAFCIFFSTIISLYIFQTM